MTRSFPFRLLSRAACAGVAHITGVSQRHSFAVRAAVLGPCAGGVDACDVRKPRGAGASAVLCRRGHDCDIPGNGPRGVFEWRESRGESRIGPRGASAPAAASTTPVAPKAAACAPIAAPEAAACAPVAAAAPPAASTPLAPTAPVPTAPACCRATSPSTNGGDDDCRWWRTVLMIGDE